VPCKLAAAVKEQITCEWSCLHELGICFLLHRWVRRSLAWNPYFLEKHIPSSFGQVEPYMLCRPDLGCVKDTIEINTISWVLCRDKTPFIGVAPLWWLAKTHITSFIRINRADEFKAVPAPSSRHLASSCKLSAPKAAHPPKLRSCAALRP
jgi:hypothetical protein